VPSPQSTFALLAVLSSVALAVVAVRQRPRHAFQMWFAAGMLAFAAESLAALLLVQRIRPVDPIACFWLLTAASSCAPLLWATVVFHPDPIRGASSRRLTLAVLGVAAGVLAVLFFAGGQSIIVRFNGFVEYMRFDAVGRGGVIVELIGAIAILAGLERCLGRLTGIERWQAKYLIVGLGSIFLVRFFYLTNLVLFNVLTTTHLATLAACTLVGNVAIAASLARGMRPISVRASRQVVFGSTVVVLLGTYLFAVGVLGWLMQHFDIPQGVFWGALLLFVAGVILAGLLLSDLLRWRLRRLIARHFYRTKYDYREQWRTFASKLRSLGTPAELAPQLLDAVAGVVGATEGALYFAAPGSDRYALAASLGPLPPLPSALESGTAILHRLHEARRPLIVDASDNGGVEAHFAVAAPLVWREGLVGMLLLGRERTGAAYTAEDVEFLGTVGEHIAAALASAELVETAAQAREFEAFHRLTSFVIHDIKNSVSGLSLLSRNALEHFDDPEFQRDAIHTVSATVARMKALLARLADPIRGGALAFDDIDLDAIVLDSLTALRADPKVRVTTQLEPVAVRGDGDALKRVVENLIVNAVEAVNGTGSVTVRTLAEQGSAVVEVIDTGMGMSEEFVRSSLFVPFRSTKPGGWGIGLYQAREIVEQHGGRIAVSSQQGEGTTFRVLLPTTAMPESSRNGRAEALPTGVS
jgi:putative PEP-CTERM system histidine kinase